MKLDKATVLITDAKHGIGLAFAPVQADEVTQQVSLVAQPVAHLQARD